MARRGGRGRPGMPRAPRRGTRPGSRPAPGPGAAAAAAARTHRPAAALLSHRPERSLNHVGETGWLLRPGVGATGPAMITRRPDAGRGPVMPRPVPAFANVTAGMATVMTGAFRGR